MAKQKRLKRDDCIIDLDPLDCWVREQCRYWLHSANRCDYIQIRTAERKAQRAEKFNDYDSTQDTLCIDRKRRHTESIQAVVKNPVKQGSE